jgi:hypothetical protein
MGSAIRDSNSLYCKLKEYVSVIAISLVLIASSFAIGNLNKIYAASSSPAPSTSPSSSITLSAGFVTCCYGSIQIQGQVQNPLPDVNQIHLQGYAPDNSLAYDKMVTLFPDGGFQGGFVIQRQYVNGSYTIVATYQGQSQKQTVPPYSTFQPQPPTFESLAAQQLSNGNILISGRVQGGIQNEPVTAAIYSPSGKLVDSLSEQSNMQAEFEFVISASDQSAFTENGNYRVVVTHVPSGVTGETTLAYTGPNGSQTAATTTTTTTNTNTVTTTSLQGQQQQQSSSSSSLSSTATATSSSAGSSNSGTSIASTTFNPAPRTIVIQEGTIASKSAGSSANATILVPAANIVYTGTISYTASKPVDLYILHAYDIGSSQAIDDAFGKLMTVSINGQLYALTTLSSVSSNGDSESTLFSGKGLMLVSSNGSFIASYKIKATADASTVVNDFGSAIAPATGSVNLPSNQQPSSATNVIADPGFEDNYLSQDDSYPVGHWGATTSGDFDGAGGIIDVSNADKHSGNYSIHIISNTSQAAYMWQFYNFTSSTYTFSFWYKGSTGTQGTGEVLTGWQFSPNGSFGGSILADIELGTTIFPTDGTWHQATVINDGTKQTFYRDGIQVACGNGSNIVPTQVLMGDLTTYGKSAPSLYIDDVSLISGQQYSSNC